MFIKCFPDYKFPADLNSQPGFRRRRFSFQPPWARHPAPHKAPLIPELNICLKYVAADPAPQLAYQSALKPAAGFLSRARRYQRPDPPWSGYPLNVVGRNTSFPLPNSRGDANPIKKASRIELIQDAHCPETGIPTALFPKPCGFVQAGLLTCPVFAAFPSRKERQWRARRKRPPEGLRTYSDGLVPDFHGVPY